MPKTTTSPDPDLDELPGFAQSEEPPAMGLPDDELPDEPSPSQDQPTTSPSPSPPESEPESRATPSPSTTTSTEREPDLELTDGLEYLAGGLFELFGQVLNRMARVRRRGQPTTLWIVSDEEAERFAAPMARIADRHLPDELRGGDARDVVIAGSVAMEYAAHNAAGVPGVEGQALAGPMAGDAEALRQYQEAQRVQQPPPAPPQPEPTPGAAAPEAPPLVPPTI